MTTAPIAAAPRGSKASWHTFAQAGAWAATAVILFTAEPPGHSVSSTPGVLSFPSLAKFSIAVLTGLVSLAAAIYGRRGNVMLWAGACIASLSAGFLLLALYGSLMLPWTCVTDRGSRVVIGTDLTPEGASYRARGQATCALLLKGFAYDPTAVWVDVSIFRRETELGWIFTGAVSGLGFGVVALLEALKVAGRPGGTAGRRRG